MEDPIHKMVARNPLEQRGGRRERTVLGVVLGVDRSRSIAGDKAQILEDGEGEYILCRGKKNGMIPKVWRGKVVRVLNCKTGGETDGSNNFMLLRQMEEKWTPIELNTWTTKTISACLEDRVGEKQVQLGTFVPIKDKV